MKDEEPEVIKWYDTLEWLVDDEINKVYQARKARRKPREWFSASNAGYCHRATILNRLNAKELDHDNKTKRLFWIGDVIHRAILGLAEKSGRLIASEEFVAPYGSGDISGAFDAIIKERDDSITLYELKSMNTGIFWKRVLKDKKPSIQHVYQGITYWILNKKYRIDTLKIVYFSKSDAAMRAFRVDITSELVAEVKAWWDLSREYVKNKTIPPIFVEGPQFDYWCKGCTFASNWCHGNDEVIENNLVQLGWVNSPPPERTTVINEKVKVTKVSRKKKDIKVAESESTKV
jgi:hypothetical protein